ncbi:DUF4878 domain-containing protein [Stutzerimonas kirkiae]|uniref:DUF4878 domain-containing protein n=1 Tax=Stutzerimonas kirkiae TaxID=2211392 RepID=A0A4Q9R0B6_9GAMM|nr:DUF4878 domain-containing protein [Stutzerimonas kirkiae]TBU90661.1 hypothetical protein DNJ96_16665 [Stutzerimonas kirkiae]TBV00173.1 hypothetical protein DNJ95_15870 [Stutzerimonas kirkiae]TBV04786.1 hypothetical protein DNK08_16610 [Stutzerimonas kirkiae]TBV14048.1 hypothetical protein DNK01_10585 [Stutzerimonas kirkiae]
MHQIQAAFRALIFSLLAVLLAACSGSGPEATTESFYKAAAKGDVDKAIGLISFADVGANEMVQAKGKVQMIVGQLQARIQANDGLDSVEVLSSTVSEDGNQATLHNRLNYKNGKSQDDRVRLVKEKGDWKIALK